MARFEPQLITPRQVVERLLRQGIVSEQADAETIVIDPVRSGEAGARLDKNNDDEPPPADNLPRADINFKKGTVSTHPPERGDLEQTPKPPERPDWMPDDFPKRLLIVAIEPEWPLFLRADKVIEFARRNMAEPPARGRPPGPWRTPALFELLAITKGCGWDLSQGKVAQFVLDALASQSLDQLPTERTVERWIADIGPELKRRGDAYAKKVT